MHTSLKSTLALVAIALTVVPGMKTIAKAQPLGGLPKCAEPALLSALRDSGCIAMDVGCVCANREKIFPGVVSAIGQACQPSDRAAVEALASKYCGKSPTMNATPAAPAASPKPTETSTVSSSTTAPALTPTTSTTTGPALVMDTSSPPDSTTYHKTMTYSTTSTGMPVATGGAMEVGVSAGALVVAVAGLSWVFAEL